MTSPTKHDPTWTAIYAAAFVREAHDAFARGHGWDDALVDRAREEAEACADWELERRRTNHSPTSAAGSGDDGGKKGEDE